LARGSLTRCRAARPSHVWSDDFVFDRTADGRPLRIPWENGYVESFNGVARAGHTRVPRGHIEGGLKLGAWVRTQRASRKKNTRTPDQIAQLDALGFDWELRTEAQPPVGFGAGDIDSGV